MWKKKKVTLQARLEDLYFLKLFWLRIMETKSGQTRLRGSNEELIAKPWEGQGHSQWWFMAPL